MQEHFPLQYDFYPVSFDLRHDLVMLQEHHRKYASIPKWIIKPACGRQGQGIRIVKGITTIIREFTTDCPPFVISQYIDRPLLLNGIKFDLRLYVLIASLDPLVILQFPEGLVRLASEKYSSDESNAFAHLTNYSLNKNHQHFQENTCLEQTYMHSKQAYSMLLSLLAYEGIDTTTLTTRIGALIVKSILACLQHMWAANKNHNAFQLLGFDVLIDSDLKPWLLEINLSPSLAPTSPLDQQIKTKLITDTLHVVGVQPRSQYKNRHPDHWEDPSIESLARPFLHTNRQMGDAIMSYENVLARKREFLVLYPSLDNDYSMVLDQVNKGDQAVQRWMRHKADTQS